MDPSSRINRDIVTECHMSLMIYVDSSSADKFMAHMTSNPPLVNKVKSLSEKEQVDWMVRYWADQFQSVDLDATAFLNDYARRGVCCIKDFNMQIGTFIADCAERHNLPNRQLVLRDI